MMEFDFMSYDVMEYDMWCDEMWNCDTANELYSKNLIISQSDVWKKDLYAEKR